MSDTPPVALPSWFPAATLALLVVFYIVPLLLPLPLLDHDEGRHASIAQEMVERGDWVTPSLLGQSFYDKPVFYFWLQAASLKLWGMSEAAVRLPGLLCALVTALAVGRWAGRLFGPAAVWIAVLFQGTLVFPLVCAQAPVHDVALVLWIVLALDCLWRGDEPGGGIGWDLAAGCFVGLSVLSKGLLGPLFVGIAYGGGLVLSRRVALRQWRRAAVVLGMGALVATPWYLAMSARNPGYAYYYFVERHLLGFATSTQRHADREWWFYLPLLLLGGLPWIVYLPATGSHRPPESTPDSVRPDPHAVCWSWLIIGLLFLTVARSKLPTYILPLFPPMALLAAGVWSRRCRSIQTPEESRRTALAFWLTAPALPLLPPLLAAGLPAFGYPVEPTLLIGSLLVGVVGLLPVWFWWRGRFAATLAAVGLWQGLVFLLVMTRILVPAAPNYSARDLARELNRRPAPLEVYFLEERVGSVIFYLTPAHRRALQSSNFRRLNAAEFRQQRVSPTALAVVPDREWEELNAEFPLESAPATRIGRFRIYRARDLVNHPR